MRADDLPATNKMSLHSFRCTKVLSMKNYCYLCTGLVKEKWKNNQKNNRGKKERKEKKEQRKSEQDQANKDSHTQR